MAIGCQCSSNSFRKFVTSFGTVGGWRRGPSSPQLVTFCGSLLLNLRHPIFIEIIFELVK